MNQFLFNCTRRSAIKVKENKLIKITIYSHRAAAVSLFPWSTFPLCRRNKTESTSDHVGLRDVKLEACVKSLPDPLWIQLPAHISAPPVYSKKSTLLLNMRLVRQISGCIHALYAISLVLYVLLHGDLEERRLNPLKKAADGESY